MTRYSVKTLQEKDTEPQPRTQTAPRPTPARSPRRQTRARPGLRAASSTKAGQAALRLHHIRAEPTSARHRAGEGTPMPTTGPVCPGQGDPENGWLCALLAGVRAGRGGQSWHGNTSCPDLGCQLQTVPSRGQEIPHLTPGLNRQPLTPLGGQWGTPCPVEPQLGPLSPCRWGSRHQESPFPEGELHQLPGTLPEFCSELLCPGDTCLHTPQVATLMWLNKTFASRVLGDDLGGRGVAERKDLPGSTSSFLTRSPGQPSAAGRHEQEAE